MAQQPQKPPDDAILAQLRSLPVSCLLDALYKHGYMQAQMQGVHTQLAGQKLVGRAVTMRFVPSRRDQLEHFIKGPDSAEYKALELCGAGDVLVMDAMGLRYPSAIGDIKLWRLKQRGGAGVITDGAVRDVATLKSYGIGVFAAGQTNMTMPSHMLPCSYQTPIQCGGILVMPGDYIAADDGGVVVIPQGVVQDIIATAQHIEKLEEAVMRQLAKEDVSPGKYYPFNAAAEALPDAFTGKKKPD